MLCFCLMYFQLYRVKKYNLRGRHTEVFRAKNLLREIHVSRKQNYCTVQQLLLKIKGYKMI